MSERPNGRRLVYCHCAFARVLPPDVKQRVLEGLAASGIEMEAVPDLCEMSARKDPLLADFASSPELTIAACYPRALKWLFAAAGAPLVEGPGLKVLNMREQSADEILQEIEGIHS